MGATAVHLLVSCVNGGGVFHLSPAGVSQWSKVDTTGLAPIPGGCLLARQAEGRAEVRRWLHGEVHRIELTARSLDLHDLHWHDSRLLVVATQINTVFEFDDAFHELRHWVLPGEEDSHHVNSVCVHDGRILASRFGSFSKHRGYSGRSEGAGEVYDVETGEVVLRGLSQPHSLVSHAGSLWLCDSETRRILEFSDGALRRELAVDGYARGLAFAGDTVFVGLSRSRNADAGNRERAAVLGIDLTTGEEVSRVALPVNEVYDIRVVDQDALPALRDAAFRDAVGEFDTQTHERNLAVEAIRREVSAALDERAELSALRHQAQELRMQLEAAAAQQTLAEQSAEALEGALSEERHWVAQLEAALRSACDASVASADAVDAVLRVHTDALASRDARLAAWEQEVNRALADARDESAAAAVRATAATAARDSRIGELRAHVARIEGSRSWRWTRPLRRQEPRLSEGDSSPDPGPAAPVADAGELEARLPALVAAASFVTGRELVPTPQVPSRALLPVTGLAFADSDAPIITVIVAAHGGFDMTRNCLATLGADPDPPAHEVLLVEDASHDVEMERFASVPGLRYLRNPENLGYLRSMNAALPLARGRYIVFLNNDTRPRPGWLRELLQPFSLFHDCGAVGARLLFPDGRQQESGGIVWNDGSACNHGHGETAWRVEDHAVREVDYVSAAAAMVRTDLLRVLGGFDERYAPAYYEDTDLAFRLRERGYRTFYQPYAEVVHVLGGSHGNDETQGIKRHQAINRDAFQARWGELLTRDQMPPGQHPFLARCRAQRRRSVLVVDQAPPRPEHDAGARAIWQMIQQLRQMGFDVRFWSAAPVEDALASDLLARHGVELFDEERAGQAFEPWFAAHAVYFDVVILSRIATATACLKAVRRHSEARIVYYGHDIHRIRLERQANVRGDAAVAAAAARVGALEEAVWMDAHVVLYPTDEETARVDAFLGAHPGTAARALTVPLLKFPASDGLPEGDAAPAATRRDVLFVGGFAHAPNADGVEWFAREIWPLVRGRNPSLRWVVVGQSPPLAVQALACEDVVIAGAVDESTLAACYASARVAIAPLRFGAGLKGKVIESMHHGVPCVTTPVGAEGIGTAASLSVADDPASFAEALLALVEDDVRWREASEAARAYVAGHYSAGVVERFWGQLLGPAGLPSAGDRLDRIQARH